MYRLGNRETKIIGCLLRIGVALFVIQETYQSEMMEHHNGAALVFARLHLSGGKINLLPCQCFKSKASFHCGKCMCSFSDLFIGCCHRWATIGNLFVVVVRSNFHLLLLPIRLDQIMMDLALQGWMDVNISSQNDAEFDRHCHCEN